MDSVPHLKRCTKCGDDKPLDQFYRKQSAKDGLQSRCKDCHRIWWRGYGYQYEQDRRQRDPEYNQKWLEYKRRKDQEWRESNPDKVQRDARETAQRRSSDPVLRAKYTQYEREHRQKRQRADPAFHQHLMGIAKEGQQRRRARLADVGGSYTTAEWNRLCTYFDHRCLCCGEQRPLTVDHVTPITKGGSNTINNLQPLCGSCNSRKHNKVIDYRQTLPPWMESD